MICCFDFGGFGVVDWLVCSRWVVGFYFGLCVLVFLVGAWICCFLAVVIVINLDWFGCLCWFCFVCRVFCLMLVGCYGYDVALWFDALVCCVIDWYLRLLCLLVCC